MIVDVQHIVIAVPAHKILVGDAFVVLQIRDMQRVTLRTGPDRVPAVLRCVELMRRKMRSDIETSVSPVGVMPPIQIPPWNRCSSSLPGGIPR